MAVLSLPLTFSNSFWTQDYRRGLQVLFAKLEQGVAENEEIVNFITARATAEAQIANVLLSPLPTGNGKGFDKDDGASLLMAFRGLQSASIAQGQAHKAISQELRSLVIDPFDEWAQGYKERLKQHKTTVIDNWLRSYEQSHSDLHKLRNLYLTKTRKADEVEDDAKFAPNAELSDKFTTSPRIRPVDAPHQHRTVPSRTPSVSDRIAARLKDIQRRTAGAAAAGLNAAGAAATIFESDEHAKETNGNGHHDEKKADPPLDKGKGKQREPTIEDLQQAPSDEHAGDHSDMIASPPTMSPLSNNAPLPSIPSAPAQPEMIDLGYRLSLTPRAVSALLERASAEMNLRPVRIPILGEYENCFSGEDFVTWLASHFENNHGVDKAGSYERAEEAARVLVEDLGLLRRLGEFGNGLEVSEEAFYQFRPKAFMLGLTPPEEGPGINGKPLIEREAIMKTTNNFVSLVRKAIDQAANPDSPSAHFKARQEADQADQAYRVAARALDRQRLGLEDRIEESMKLMQRWESERLRAVKTVLLQYQGTLSNLPSALSAPIETQTTVLAAYQPENDLTALIERYRTGPFRPEAVVYEGINHDESDVCFGIDLRKWDGAEVEVVGEVGKGEKVPSVVGALLGALVESYGKLGSDAEKRKAWIYEVPLPAVHHLRERLNSLPLDEPIPADIFTKYDAPVLASGVKLWLLELNPPLTMWEGWDDIKKLYPAVGSAKTEVKESEEAQRLQELSGTLQKLPRIHLYVLDAVISHLKNLIDTTKVEEADEVYHTKLALSFGRTIIRPKTESPLSIQARHPTLLFIDLLKNYASILPPTIARKKRESERKVPIRKRTAAVDARISRSKISQGQDPRELLLAQQNAKNPNLGRNVENVPPVPPMPPVVLPGNKATPPPPPPLPVTTATTPKAFVPPGPPPPIVAPGPPPPLAAPGPPPPLPKESNHPPRPSFKEPPPEEDDLPPRPSFKEPPPELEDESPARPTFAPDSGSPPTSAAPATQVIPPTPLSKTARRQSQLSERSASPSPSRGEHSDSHAGNNAPLRRSMVTRGPRVVGGGGGAVGSMVANLNRQSIGGSPTSPSMGHVGRASMSGRLNRRTMESDAEE